MENKFTKEDKEKLIEFINFLATKCKLDGITISDNIKFYGLLSFVQKELIPKIENNILEVVKVVESEDNKEE